MTLPSPLPEPDEFSERASGEDRDGDERRYEREVFEEDPIMSPASVVSVWSEGKSSNSRPGWKRIRHAIGIVLLLATVFLWTTSNFLASVSHPFLLLRFFFSPSPWNVYVDVYADADGV